VTEQDAQPGWVEREVGEEFPELALMEMVVAAAPARSPQGLRDQLRQLSSRFHGAHAIVMRRQPVPGAYRAFFRQVGLDPDSDRTPIEEAAMRRLVQGSFRSEGIVPDALLLALVETGVPVWALDDAKLDGPLGIRGAKAGEHLGHGEYADELPPGRLVVADAREPVSVLFGQHSPAHVVGKETTSIRLFAVQVAGVPEIHVSESLWMATEALASR
jgi:DNA/RNA-binding domain of Phe-tRNA-synthetase-like protein